MRNDILLILFTACLLMALLTLEPAFLIPLPILLIIDFILFIRKDNHNARN